MLASVTTAQSFNIDVTVNPSQTPPPSYSGYTSQQGVWNAVVPSTTPVPLLNLAGVADNSDISMTTFATGLAPNTGANAPLSIPTPHRELYEDYATEAFTTFVVDIDDMDAGDYVAVLYSYAPAAQSYCQVFSQNVAFGPGVVSCPATFPGLVPGASLTQIPFSVFLQNDPIQIWVSTELFSALNGIQIVRTSDQGMIGCDQLPNSTGGVPQIIATGTFNAAGESTADDLALNVGLLPGNLPGTTGSILCFASNSLLGTPIQLSCPSVGQLCIAGGARIPDPNALPGSGGAGFSNNGTYVLPVGRMTLAAAGLSVSSGSTVYFQMVYRDIPVGSGCAQASIIRWTRSLGVVLR
jgi:hypothetical protein